METRTFSSIPPDFSIEERLDLFALEVCINDVSVVEFISKGFLETFATTSKEVNDVYIMMSQNWPHRFIPLKSQGILLAPIITKQSQLTEPYHFKIYFHSAYILSSEDSILFLVALKEPANTNKAYEELIIRAKELFEKYEEEVDILDKKNEQEKIKREELYEKLPKLKEIDGGWPIINNQQNPSITAEPLIGLFPKAVYFKLGRKSLDAMVRSAVALASKSSWAPPREGNYESIITYDNERKKILVVTWQPHIGLPPYPEIRWSLLNKYQKFLEKVRRGDICKPDLSDLEGNKINVTDIKYIYIIDEQDLEPALTDLQLEDNYYRERIEGTKGALKKGGFEAIGWYQSFHIWDEQRWGIYIDAKMLDDYALTIYDDCRRKGLVCSMSLCGHLAFGMVFHHEFFHAKIEAILTWVELTNGKPKYLRYKENVYQKLRGTDEWLEEALANWNSFYWYLEFFDKKKILTESEQRLMKEVIEAELDMSPPGYNNWRSGSKVVNWRRIALQLSRGKAKIADNYLLPLEGLLLGEMPFDIRTSDIPLKFIGKGQIADRIHSHPKTLSVPGRKEIQLALKYYKYKLISGGKGSHEKWEGADNSTFIVPTGDPVSRGVFRTFLTHFNIDKKFYIENIRPNL